MATLTITVDDQILEQARRQAAEEGMSVDAVLVRYLATYVAPASHGGGGVNAFLELTQDWDAGSGPGGRTWKREDLYDDP